MIHCFMIKNTITFPILKVYYFKNYKAHGFFEKCTELIQKDAPFWFWKQGYFIL